MSYRKQLLDSVICELDINKVITRKKVLQLSAKTRNVTSISKKSIYTANQVILFLLKCKIMKTIENGLYVKV